MPFTFPTVSALILALPVAFLAPCATTDTGSGPATPRPERSVADDEDPGPAEREASPPAVEAPPPPPDPALAIVRDEAILSALTPSVVANLRAIAARAERDERSFAKLGGSSVVSHAFLHCFADDNALELGSRDAELRESLEFFRGPRRRNAFSRNSEAAAVGWSLRQGLAGRPSRIMREIRALSPRYALVLFGGNDVQGRNEIVFAERLDQVVEELSEHGVIPILGAVLPRLDDPEMDHWASRYNQVSRAVAAAWEIPYIDYHRAVRDLPHAGLAHDGVHPNVFLDGGRGRPCILNQDGLRHGQNQRNLWTLTMLDRLRRQVAPPEASAVDGGSAAAAGAEGNADGDVEPERSPESVESNGVAVEDGRAEETPAELGGALYGEGTLEAPLRLASLPYAERVEARAARASLACPAGPVGRARVYRLRAERALSLEVRVMARDTEVRAVLLDEAGDCVASDDRGVLFSERDAGITRLAVVLPADAPDDAAVLIALDGELTDSPSDSSSDDSSSDDDSPSDDSPSDDPPSDDPPSDDPPSDDSPSGEAVGAPATTPGE